MTSQGFQISEFPELKTPIVIAGFGGWGNALDISRGMATYLIRKLKAQMFASIDPDVFFRYDSLRPEVDIKDGLLVRFDPPGGSIYAAHLDAGQNDLVVLEADEPNLQWNRFAKELFSLCRKLGVNTVITLGSMYDNVLHSDRIISGIASHEDALFRLKQKGVIPVSYQGPGRGIAFEKGHSDQLPRTERNPFAHTDGRTKEGPPVHQPVVSLPVLFAEYQALRPAVPFGRCIVFSG
jgi:proteasome assembly chaperone (PAC2) family protein